MKNYLLAMSLSFAFVGAAHATDDFIKKTINYCSSNGGTSKIEKTNQTADKECFKILCYKAVGVTGVDFSASIDDIRSKLTGAGAAVIAFEPNACRDYKEPTVDDLINGSGNGNGNNNGPTGGNNNGNGNNNGPTGGSNNGNGNNNGPTGGNNNGNGNNGPTGGSNNGNGNTGPGVLECETTVGKIEIHEGGQCWDACKPKRSWFLGKKKADLERKSCVECLMGMGYDFPDAVKKKAGVRIIVGATNGPGSVTICRDANGNIVSRTSSGVCPGNHNHGSTTTVLSPGTNPSTNTTVVSPGTGPGSTSVVVTGTGSLQLPEVCKSTKKKDKVACENWMRLNARYACASSGNSTACMGGEYVNDVQSRYNTDCINCAGGGGRRGGTDWSAAIGGVASALGQVGSAYFTGRAYERGQKAWADAAVKTAEQCTINNNNYLQYTMTNELAAVTPEQQAAMGCNGYNLNGYAGMGGGLGAWGGSGYSNMYLGGMLGPYGGYNPYGGGGYIGGAIGGAVGGIGGYIQGGMQGGYIQGGGYIAGMQGGYIAGMQGGYPAGMQGGYIQGGYAAGMQGGYISGMQGGGLIGGLISGGIGGGGYAAGMQGGYISGYAGGYAQGGYISGYAGGIAGGYAQGGYISGMQGGGYTSGIIGGISVAAGAAAGYNGGYIGGMGGGYGGYPYGTGGWGSGVGQGGMYGQGNYWAASQQAGNYDRMLQQQGVSYQMGMAGGMGGYGSAGYNPMNAGGAFNTQFNAGFYGM